ncbi:MAG: aldose 1-epimerase [Alphaproteobacteria bacterium]|nr:aldose 1-epimerase [Alphaproteobacteria bacterium]
MPFSIASKNCSLSAIPEKGGVISAFQYKNIDVFKPYDPLLQKYGSFLMAPYTNRIAKGELTFEGRVYKLPLFPDEAPHNALHGDAWGPDTQWQGCKTAKNQLVLTIDKKNGETPYKYEAERIITMEDDALVVTSSIINRGERLPFTIGEHPFCLTTPQSVVRFTAEKVQLCDEVMHHREFTAIPPEWDCSNGRAISNFQQAIGQGFGGKDALDNCFLGLKTPVTLTRPEDGIGLRIIGDAKEINYMMYIPPAGQQFIVMETVPNYVDQFNQEDPEKFVLETDELYTVTTRYELYSL